MPGLIEAAILLAVLAMSIAFAYVAQTSSGRTKGIGTAA